MKLVVKFIAINLSFILSAFNISGQVTEICGELGINPSFDLPSAQVPYVYGKISLKGFDSNAKSPKVTVILADGQQSAQRWMIGESGNYCFKRKGSGNGTLTVEVDGLEVGRKSVSSFAPAQQREDFEIYSDSSQKSLPPGVISAKFFHPTNSKTVELYKKTNEAESTKDTQKPLEYLKEIVKIDPADFIAWAKLGLIYFEKNSITDAEAAFKKSLELKIEYTPAWVNIGMIRVAQKQFLAAIEVFKYAASLEPKSARIYQLLGEAYLQTKQGSLGAEALTKAIELDPLGMAECHLQLAHLYQLAKANQMATKEYKIFLTKVPNYKDKKKFEEFIKKNPE